MVRPAKASESAQFVHAGDEGGYFRAFAEKHCKKRSLVRFTECVAINKAGLETMNIEAILRFYFRESEEASGRAAVELPEQLLSELRRFAAADLPQEELEEFCARIASNSAAIEVLAREIKKRWDPKEDQQ